MAKEIVVWCDPHLAEGDEHRSAKTYVLPIAGEKSVDLCDECYEKVLRPVYELAMEYGKAADEPLAVPKPKAKKRVRDGEMEREDGPYLCRVPNCTGYLQAGYKSRARLRGHVRQTHSLSWEEYEALYGATTPPVDQERQTEWRCPDCDEVYTYERTNRPPQALGAHRAAKHNYRVRNAEASAS